LIKIKHKIPQYFESCYEHMKTNPSFYAIIKIVIYEDSDQYYIDFKKIDGDSIIYYDFYNTVKDSITK